MRTLWPDQHGHQPWITIEDGDRFGQLRSGLIPDVLEQIFPHCGLFILGISFNLFSSKHRSNKLSHKQLMQDHWVMTRCVLIEPLDQHGKPIQKAGGRSLGSGFITNTHTSYGLGKHGPEYGALRLFTCWHVVANHDPSDSNSPKDYVQPRYLRIHGVRETGERAIDGVECITVPLFGSDGLALWVQELSDKKHFFFNDLGVFVPESVDVISIDIECTIEQTRWWAIGPEHTENSFFELGEDVFVCGFPYGFQAMTGQIIPVFLKRSIAARWSTRISVSLLDSGCQPVMSGGPIFRKNKENWALAGMYSGTVFTRPDLPNESERKATALGTAMSFASISQSLRRAS